MARQRFRAKVETVGRGGYFITIGRPVAAKFGSRARLPVRGTVNGIPYRSSIFPRGDGNFYMVLNRALREAGAISGGDVVQVTMEPDTTPRKVQVPRALQQALRRNRRAAAFWGTLSYSHRREYVEWIAEAKQEETQRRRIGKAVEMLAAGRRERS